MKRKLIMMCLCLFVGFVAHSQNISAVNSAQNPVTEGTTLSVTISGNNTNFNQGSALIYVDFGGTSVNGYQVGPGTNTSMDVVFSLPCGVCGNATLVVNHVIDGFMSFPNAFDVTCMQVNAVNTNSISAGQSLPIGISGTGIDFSQGSTTIYFRGSNSGQLIAPSSYNGFTQDSVNVNLSIPTNYVCNELFDICITNSNGCHDCLLNAMTVNGTGLQPQITGLSPNAGPGGQSLDITISGTNTNFTQGSYLVPHLVNTVTGAVLWPFSSVNVLNQNEIRPRFHIPAVCGTYDLYVYGLDPCSTNPVIYNNAYTVNALYSPQLYTLAQTTAMTQQTYTMDLSGFSMYFNQNGSIMNFSLVNATTGAILTGTNFVPNSVNPNQATIDFTLGANDCGSYHLVVDSVSTGCSDFTTIIDSNAIIINSPTNPQVQSISPSQALVGQTVNMTVIASNLDFNFVNPSDVVLSETGIWNNLTITAVSIVPNSSNPNEAIITFNLPSFIIGNFDLIISNVANCGANTVMHLNSFLIYYPVGGIDIPKSEISVRVYPNPMDQYATIEVTSDESQPIQFYLFDMLGRLIRSESIESNSNFNLERNALPSGMYLYKLLDKKGDMLKVGKLELR